MYKSKQNIQKGSIELLKRHMTSFLTRNKFVYCSALKRKVFLNKLPDVIMHRKKTRKKRLECFRVACDVSLHARTYTKREGARHCIEIEICGMSADGLKVCVHIREEMTRGNNRKLFFVSCFSVTK